MSCGVEGECLALGPGVEHFSGVRSVEECQGLCWQRRRTCHYFTYYNQSANLGEDTTPVSRGQGVMVMFQSWPPPVTCSPCVSSHPTAEAVRRVLQTVRRGVLCLQTGEVTGIVTTTVATSPTLQHTPTVLVSHAF